MAPTIDDTRVYDVRLGAEDVKAIQRLYGLKTRKSPATLRPSIPRSTTTTTQKPHLWDRLLPTFGLSGPDLTNEVWLAGSNGSDDYLDFRLTECTLLYAKEEHWRP